MLPLSGLTNLLTPVATTGLELGVAKAIGNKINGIVTNGQDAGPNGGLVGPSAGMPTIPGLDGPSRGR